MSAGQIKKDPAAFLEAEIKAYIANSPGNIPRKSMICASAQFHEYNS